MSDRSVQRASVGPYEIRALLSKGGGGEVYRAWDPRLEREVALKILHERFEGDPERLKSFVAEARAASGLNHPNIVTVFDAAVEGSTPYIVSELIDGRPLLVDLGDGALPIKRLLDLATQIADGLSAAHDAGIRHGDLKPENIMVTRTGRAKIVDFGLTRPAGFRSNSAQPAGHDLQTETVPGLIAGTVPYMSPEQARGLELDFRSDQFSFGLILHEMATGRRAFLGDTPAETLDAIVNDEAPVTALDPRAPVLLRWIIERCLAKDPADRYGATSDLHRDLRTLRDRLAETAIAPVGTRPPAATWQWWLLLAGGAVALLSLGTLLANARRGPSPPDISALSFTPLATEPGYQGFPAMSPTGQSVAYSAEVDGTLQIFTRKVASSESFQVTHERYDCKYPFWSTDGQRIYYISLAGSSDGLYSISATSGTSQIVVMNANRAAISPDNATIAFLRDETKADIVGTAALWLSTPGGPAPWSREKVEAAARRRGTFDGQEFIEGTLAFSPDGKKLGVCVVPNPRVDSVWQFWIVPLPDGKEYRRLEAWAEPAPRPSSFTWLPDNQHIVLGVTSLRTPGSHLWLADLDADRVWPLTNAADSESYPSASPQGDQIVFTRGEPHYDVVQIALDDPVGIRPVLQTARNESDAEMSRNGKQLVYVTDQTGHDEIWLRSHDGQVRDRPLVTQADFGDDFTLMLAAPSISPAGDRVAYLRNGLKPRFILRVWISTIEGGLRTPLLPRAYEAMQGAPTWSADGQSIAYPEWKDNHWNLVTMRVDGQGEPVTIRTDGVANATPHWSPDGTMITWETDHGFMLVSPDGRTGRSLTDDNDIWSDTPWLVHAWSHDGKEIFGIKMTDDRRLKLVAVRVATGRTRELKDLGRSPIVNNPVKGFSVSADGRTFTTSIAQLPGDLWVLHGLEWHATPWWRR